MYRIHLLPAGFGDSILIEYGLEGEQKYILIDGGPYYNYPVLSSALKRICPDLRSLELLIVTHIDIDHIDGIIRLLNEKTISFEIDQIWFNGYEQLCKIPNDMLGIDQGDYLSILIKEKNIKQNITHFEGGPIMIPSSGILPNFILPGGMEITVISPAQDALEELLLNWERESKYLKDPEAFRKQLEEDNRYIGLDLLGEEDISDWQSETVIGDTSLANRSSIAFIGRYEGKSCLYSADAPTETHLNALNELLKESGEQELKVDAWKLAHHGSKKSTLSGLMKKINADKILVSSDGQRYKHPDPQTIAKLLSAKKENVEIYFNYLTKFNKYWNDESRQNDLFYKAFYGENEMGLTVNL